MQTGLEIRPYRPDIDGLRSVAILSVMLAHGGFAGFAGGDTALAAFFVISGYLVTHALLVSGTTVSLAEFYDRRARRMLPTLLVATAAALVAGSLLLSPAEITGLSRAALASVALVSNLVVSGESGADPLLHTWSLSMAGQFFLILPLAVVLLGRVGGRVAVALVVAATLASFAIGMADTPAAGAAPLHHRLWQFGAGALIAFVPFNPPGRGVAEFLAALGVAAVLVPVFTAGNGISGSGAGTLPTVLGTALVIWANRHETAARNVLGSAPVMFLGVISYSLYVWHWPMLMFARRVWGDLGTGGSLAWLSATVFVAILSWYFIEQPLRYPTGPIRSRAAVLAASLAGFVSVAALAAVVASDRVVAVAPGATAAHAAEGPRPCLRACAVAIPELAARSR